MSDIRTSIMHILISGVAAETKVESLLQVYNQFQETGFILGWLEVRVRAPEPKELIDIRYNDGTIVFKRQADEDLLTKMRQKDALWRPAILEI